MKFAGIMNDSGRAAGRCGLGALMGSKNLKAVAASGNLRPELANAEKVRELARQAVATINGNLVSVAFREYGTMMYLDMAMTLGDAPAKYFTKSIFPVSKITGQALRQAYTVHNYACLGCPIGCGRDGVVIAAGVVIATIVIIAAAVAVIAVAGVVIAIVVAIIIISIAALVVITVVIGVAVIIISVAIVVITIAIIVVIYIGIGVVIIGVVVVVHIPVLIFVFCRVGVFILVRRRARERAA